MSYLDEITQLSIQAQEVISRLALIQAERSEAGEGSPKLRDQILRFTQLLSQSLNTSLSEENRLKLLTRLVNDARLAEVPYYPYPPIEVTVVPTQRYVGDHNSLSNIEGDGFYHISAAQRSRLLSALQPADLTFVGILGLPGDNVALAAVLAGKEPVISPSGNAAEFLNGNKVFAVVQYNQIGGRPTTLAGLGISASDTLFDGKYLQLSSPLTGLSTLVGTQLDSSTTIIQGFGRLQNQVNSKEPSLGNPGADGYVLSSTMAGVRSWVPAPTGAEVTSISIVGANGFAGSVVIASGSADVTLSTSVTGMVKGDGTSLSAATEMTDYIGISGASEGYTILFTGGVATWAPGLSNPMDGPGQMIYGGASGVTTKLAANATSTNKFLRSVASGNPSWETLVAADIPAIGINQVTGLTTALANKLATTLTDGKMFVGNAANAAAEVTMSGDATISNAGVITIGDSKVTFAKMQNITYKTLMGRWSAGDGTVQEVTIGAGLSLSGTGVLTSGGLVNPMTTVGDLIVGGTGGDPTRLPIGTNTYVLTSNGTTAVWAAAATGSGDVTGPSSSTNGNFAVFNGTTGKIIKQPTGSSLDNSGNASFLSVAIAGTGGSGFLRLRDQASAVSGTANNTSIYSLATGSNGLGFIIGSAAYASSIVFGATLARTYTLPDLSGTVALLANPASFTTLTATTSLTVGTASSSAGDVVFQNASNAFTQTIRGTNTSASIVYLLPTTAPTAGQALVSTAPSGGVATLSWSTISGSGVTTVNSFSGSSQTNGASISSTTITFGPADGTNPGMVSTGPQTIAGAKTFTSNILFSGSANAPTLTSRSVGTRVVLNGTLSSTALDYAFGIGSSSLWMSLGASSDTFQIYAPISSVVTSIFSVTVSAGMSFNGSSLTFGTSTTSTNVRSGSTDQGIVSRNFINLGTGGSAGAPVSIGSSWASRSLGTRLIVQSSGTPTQSDVAIGYNTNEMWSSILLNTSAHSFGWYAGPGVSGGAPAIKLMTLQGDGNLAIGASSSFGGGVGVVFMANATTSPTTNPSGGGILYTESGALKYRGSSGTVTTLGAA